MKGISAVIGALIILIITLALGGLAYTFITTSTTRQISALIEVDPGLTRCTISGTVYSIVAGVKNTGTDVLAWSSISVSGTNAGGTALTNNGACLNAGNLAAGQSGTCSRPDPDGIGPLVIGLNGGSTGTNKVTIAAGSSSVSGVVTCVGL